MIEFCAVRILQKTLALLQFQIECSFFNQPFSNNPFSNICASIP